MKIRDFIYSGLFLLSSSILVAAPAFAQSNPDKATEVIRKDGRIFLGDDSDLSDGAPLTPGGAPKGMVLIPAGEFLAGEVNAPKPMRLDAFYIDKYEVTQKEFERVIGFNTAGHRGEDLPVEKVSWHMAKEFCGKLGKRLPTEWEWEKAAKGKSNTKFYWGDKMDGDYAWYKKNSENKTHPVGQKKPNSYGLYDTAGNVWEWVADWFSDKEKYKVLRGGAWFFFGDFIRPANRINILPNYRLTYFGFRCAK